MRNYSECTILKQYMLTERTIIYSVRTKIRIYFF